MKSIMKKMLAAVLATVIMVVPLAASAAPAPNATINITVDDEYELYLNGVKIGEDKGQNKWQSAENYRVYLDENSIIAVRANDAYQTIAGMSLTIYYDDARPDAVASSGTGWLVRPGFDANWVAPSFTPGGDWADVHNISPNNTGWNNNLGVRQWVWTSKYLYSSNSSMFDPLVTFRFTASAPIPWTVTFDSMGGSTVPSQSVDGGDTATEPADPTMEGYTFVGWGLLDSTEAFDFSTPINSDVTLYAVWQDAPSPWTVTFDSTGGSAVDSQSVDDGDTATEPADPTRLGFTFTSWILPQAEGDFDFSTPITGDITLYAVWEEVFGPWTVTFDSAGGSAVASQSVDDGDLATEPSDPDRPGYTFLGWFILQSADEFDFSTPITRDIALYARWSEVIIDYYTVTYLPGSQGTFVSQTTPGLLAGMPTPGAPTVTGASGWFFVGWSPLVSPTVTGNATYTAQWQQEVQPVVYVVAASAEIGGTAAGGGTFLPGVFTTVDATAGAGFTFDGWFENNVLVSSDASYTFQVLANRTLVAKFEPIPVATFYDVTASAGIGGSAAGSGTFLAGSSATVIATPETGFEFVGWFENGVPVSSSLVYTVVVNRDYALDAVFELELIDEPEVPGAPELPETGATPFTFFYVFGAALGVAGISLGRKKSR